MQTERSRDFETMRDFFLKFTNYLRDRSNFIKSGTAIVGSMSAIGLLMMFGKFGGIGWWLFLAVLAFLAGWVWACFMWFVCKDELQRVPTVSSSPKTTDGAPE